MEVFISSNTNSMNSTLNYPLYSGIFLQQTRKTPQRSKGEHDMSKLGNMCLFYFPAFSQQPNGIWRTKFKRLLKHNPLKQKKVSNFFFLWSFIFSSSTKQIKIVYMHHTPIYSKRYYIIQQSHQFILFSCILS